MYITYFDFGLIIYDLSNPASPVQIGSYETDFAERATAVSGDYAYIACRDSGLVVLDISDPGSPFEVSRLPGKAWDVAISGQYAFIAAEAAGLRVIDISDPDSLQEVDSYSTPLDALDVMVRDGYAYVRLPESGLSAKDVSAYYQGDSQNNKGDLAVGDVSAYVIDELAWYGGYGCGIRSIGISDPDHLGQNGYYLTYGSIQDVDLIGDYAYLAAVWGGLRAIDVSNPQAPGEVGYVNADHIEDLCLGLVIKNEDQAYMRTGICDLRWVSLADPTFYYREYINYTLCYETGGHAKAIALANDTVYTIEEGSQGSGGFHIYDEDIDEIGYVYSAASGRDMAIEGDYAFIATESTGLVVIDISDPTAPDEIAAYGSSYGTMNGIEVSGDYAYVAAYNHGLKVIDISDPSSPGEVGGYDTSGKPRDVALSGSTVYLADGSTGVRVIDVSGPTAPEEIGYYDMEGDAYKVKVAPDGRVYAACGSGGFISSNTLL